MPSGRASSPRKVHQCTSASSAPCVTQICEAPVAATVAHKPSQSAWSEITIGSSTPRWRARARTRIQPDANAETGSGNRRVQRSCSEEGGQSAMTPARSAFLASRTARNSPRSIPRET